MLFQGKDSSCGSEYSDKVKQIPSLLNSMIRKQNIFKEEKNTVIIELLNFIYRRIYNAVYQNNIM